MGNNYYRWPETVLFALVKIKQDING